MSQSKADLIEERKANLPLPEQPPVPSDFNSADERTVNVGSGGQPSDIANNPLHEPGTGIDDLSNVGRQAKDNLPGVPNDAVTREKKDHTNTVNTTGKDYGYPQKSDPSKGL